MVSSEKELYRKKYKKIREDRDWTQIKVISSMIFEKLERSQIYEEAQSIFSYLSMEKEISTWDFLQDSLERKKKIYVPKTIRGSREMEVLRLKDFSQLEMGEFGIYTVKEGAEKGDLNHIDLAIIPGLVFDLDGGRLGYGAGYYDRALIDKDILKIAVCMESQLAEKVPTEAWDISVDYIQTERELYKCQKGA